jgi:tRNA-Thr(GGU) m(6)t(6)A37 methyltransferase TsaA
MTPEGEYQDQPLRPIGVIRTPFTQVTGTPIQPTYAVDSVGRIVVDEAYEAALKDIEGFERLWLIYWMHRTGGFRPQVIPYRDTVAHGIFATRSPSRPNPIGISVVRLLGRSGATLQVADLDILDGTPLLDIKPYVPEFDAHSPSRAGWLDRPGTDRRTADERFHEEP